MKNKFRLKAMFWVSVVGLLSSCGGETLNGQRNVRVIHIGRELPFPIDTVWNRIFMDFGNVHKYHPGLVNSGYLDGASEAKIGSARFIENTDGGKIHERITKIDPVNKSMTFKMYEAIDVPLDTEVSFGESSLEAIDDNRTMFRLAFYYRTKPKLLALVANGQIRQDLENMTVGIAHFLSTRESVTAENFEEISKLYP